MPLQLSMFGALVATNEEPGRIIFVARKGRRPFTRAIELEGSNVTHESKFLTENLAIFSAAGKGAKYLFIFPRPDAGLVEGVVRDLELRLREPASHAEVAADSANPRG